MTSDAGSADNLYQSAHDAYLFTVPLVIMETFRRRRLTGGEMNQLFHARDLLTDRSRQITAPNNDTLYTDAWLDLTKGPVTLEFPTVGERYLSFAMMDFYTNNFTVLGTRTSGPEGCRVTIVGPDDSTKGIEGMIARSPTPYAWALARILADGPDDLPNARAVQDQITLEAPGPALAPVESTLGDGEAVPAGGIDRAAPWAEYFNEAARLMGLHRPGAMDEKMIRRMAGIALVPGAEFDAGALDADSAEAVEAGVAAARATLVRVQAAIGRGGNGRGWVKPRRNLGLYNQDYFFRAVVAVGGLGAPPLDEATYLRSGGAGGISYDGNSLWNLHFPADQPLPAKSFWSLSMYEPTEDGEFFFTRNDIKRYSIGDRTPGLEYNPDGSLDIWMSATPPGKGRDSNWLPAPPGPFQLILRAYLPEEVLLDGRYTPPSPTPVDGY